MRRACRLCTTVIVTALLLAISPDPGSSRIAALGAGPEAAQRFIQIRNHHVAVASLNAALDALWIHVYAKKCRAIHRRGQRLRSAHSAHTAGHDQLTSQIAAKMRLRSGGKRFVRALQNSLRADINPARSSSLNWSQLFQRPTRLELQSNTRGA